jgi:hypothetical protein
MKTITQRDLPPPPARARWHVGLLLAMGAVGLVVALAAVVVPGGGTARLNVVAQGLMLASATLLFGPPHPWRIARLGGTMLAALAVAVLLAATSDPATGVSGLATWLFIVGSSTLSVIGVLSLWRPHLVYRKREPTERRMTQETARRVVWVLVGLAVVLAALVALLMVLIFASRP